MSKKKSGGRIFNYLYDNWLKQVEHFFTYCYAYTFTIMGVWFWHETGKYVFVVCGALSIVGTWWGVKQIKAYWDGKENSRIGG